MILTDDLDDRYAELLAELDREDQAGERGELVVASATGYLFRMLDQQARRLA